MKIAVIGAGSFGTALSNVLADNNHDVSIWSHSEAVITDINNQHKNSKYLGDIELNHSIHAFSEINEDISFYEMILLVVPSHAMREVVTKLKPFIMPNQVIMHASKGLELDTNKRLSEVIVDVLGDAFKQQVAVLSGPSHAEEVVLRKPTTVAIASYNKFLPMTLLDIFNNDYFRTYANDDIVGVEICGSFKNIIAIAAGICDGLELGDNTKAALVSRGLAEMGRITVALGGSFSTLAGLAGVGDLMVTCNSVHSRNWRTGNLLAKGHSLDEVLASLGMVSEGVKATKAAYSFSKILEIDMPITSELYEILFNNKSPQESIPALMGRTYKKETI